MKFFLKKQKINIFFIFTCLLFSFSSSEEIDFGKFYNRTSLKGLENFYTISFSNIFTSKIYIDIIIYIGEIEVSFTNEIISSKQIISVNHIIYKINIPVDLKKFNFVITSKANSYYLLFTNYEQNILYDSSMTMINELQTGFSYIINIDPNQRDYNNEMKNIIKFKQKYFNQKRPIMSSFYTLNCKFDIKQIYKDSEQNDQSKDIKKYENFFHDLIKPDDTEKYSNELEYKITIIENDPTQYDGYLCQLFAYSVELSDKYEENINDIIVPDNNPQQVMFTNDVKHVTYGYIHLDLEKGLMIKFFPKDIAKYKIRLYFNYDKREKEEIIIGKNVIYLKPEEWSDKCIDESKGCYIQLDITLEKIKNDENPILEFSFQMVGTNSVSYLPKRILKNDFLHNNNSQIYYTEIASNEEGFITVNFLRGEGKVYFRIVEENGEEGKNQIEDEIWRGKYAFPDESKIFYYSKKRTEFYETNNCEKGCYLLIKIFSNFNNTEEITEVNFPFSIIVNSFDKSFFEYNYNEGMPTIKIQNDELIVGAVKYVGREDLILEFYTIILNSNAKRVLIDFQSDTTSLYINVGDTMPSTSKNHFKYEPKGKDGIFTLSEEKILGLLKNREENFVYTGLKDTVLTLGIKATAKNVNSQNLFSFVVRLMNDTENDVYKVNSDKKALCNTKMISKDKYRCIYSIENYNIESENYLLIYPVPQNKSALFKIYGKFVDQTDFEFIPETKLNELIPNEKNAKNSNQDSNGEYLIIKEGFGNLLVTVETDLNTTVELYSSIYLFQKSMDVNDYEQKLFLGLKDKRFRINFPNDGILYYMVNIKCIEGIADIYWDRNPDKRYHLEGKDDRISITTENLARNNLFFSAKGNITENIGIIFYLKIQPRVSQLNFDELILDSSSNYFYSGNDLPINYFAPIPKSILDNNEYYEIFFSFNFLENNQTIKKYYQYIPFLVDSYIVDYDIILRTKNEPDEITVQPSNNIKGKYDPLLKTGYIKITKNNINGPYVEKDRPYLFLIINKFGNNKKEEYNSFSLEVSAIKNMPESPVSELTYQFGKLEINQKERTYKLRVDRTFKYMFIKFSCTNNNALSIEIDRRKLIKKITEYGRTIYSLETTRNDLILLLKIKRTDNITSEEYFTFQYMHANNDDIIKEYKIIKSSKLNITKNIIPEENDEDIQRANFTIKLNPIENYENYSITYLVRGIDTSINNNYKIKKEDLSLKFLTNQYYLEYNNPKVNENGILIFNLDNTTDSVKYIQVIAQIKDKNKERIEYLSYDIYSEFYNEDEDEDDNKKKKLLIILIAFGSLILLVAFILTIIVIYIHIKNKNLIDRVKKTSFSMDRDSKAESEITEDLLSGKGDNILNN